MVLAGLDSNRWVLGLERVRAALDSLGNPQSRYRSVLVGGTNGKGSTCVYLERLLLDSGVNVGTNLSPHVSSFGERFRIGGRCLSTAEAEGLMAELEPRLNKFDLTYFEWCVVLAAEAFARAAVAVAIFEIGLGGRLDAANAIEPAIALITNVSLDHTDYLGPTVEAIAVEKAQIARNAKPLLTTCDEPALGVVRQCAAEIGAELKVIKEAWAGLSHHQGLNAALALAACRKLGFEPEHPAYAIATAFLPGRQERVGDRIIMDVAHNPAAIERLAEKLGNGRYVGVVGILADKDYPQMLVQLGRLCSKLYLAPLDSPRSWQPADLTADWPEAVICADVAEAFKLALADGGPIVVTGSFLTVGGVRDAIICQG